MAKECKKCPYWKDNIEEINRHLTISFIHGINYKGKSFEFCPYCGHELTEAEEK